MKKNIENINIRELTLKNGIAYPTDTELIMMILGSGTKECPVEYMAQNILKVLQSTNPEDWIDNLLKLKGVGKSRAMAIIAAMELGRRLNRTPQARLEKPSDIIPFVKYYGLMPTEHFICITVNGCREILNLRVICTGSGNMAILKPGEIFCEPLKERASGLIICHNHPNGNPVPSNEDLKTTKVLGKAAEILGIPLLDHIIITKNSYFSFLEHNLLKS